MGSSYIGTLRIISSCKDASLPEPEIKEADGGILVTLFKNKLTEEQLRKQGLNERQILAITYLKQHPIITNKIYQEICDTSERTALRDLDQLVELNFLTTW